MKIINKIKEIMSSKIFKRVVLFVGLPLVCIVAFGFYQFSNSQQTRGAAFSNLQLEPAQIGTLQSTVGATGKVRASQSTILRWGTSGTVESVYVQVGDQVKAGDVLAELAQTSLPQSVINAQVDLYNAQVALDAVYESYSPETLLEALKSIALAEQSVEEAAYYLNSLNSPASQTNIDQANAQVVIAEDNLRKAEERYVPYANKPEDNVNRARFLAQVASAQEVFDSAARTLNYLLGSADGTDLTIAEIDYGLSQAQVADTQADYELISDGPTVAELAAAEARIDSAQATLDLALLEAPFSGTITDAFPQAGDQITGNTDAFRIDNLSTLLVDLEINEVDINQIEVGQSATITFDAINRSVFTGEVVQVSLAGEQTSGVVTFTVTVALLDADEDVKPGMTAVVEILVSQGEQALLIPNQAIRLENGESVVYILSPGGVIVPVQVTLGNSSDTHSEVIAGDLQVGDRIVLNPSQDALTDQSGPIFRLGPGGGQGQGGRGFGGGGGQGNGGNNDDN